VHSNQGLRPITNRPRVKRLASWIAQLFAGGTRMPKMLLCFLLSLFMLASGECALAKDPPKLEKIEWTDIWVTNASQTGLPRVLLVGDSIVQGYFRDVEKDLDGKADCAKLATSMFLSNPDYIDQLKVMLQRYRFRVIHINNGLHGWAYTEADYRESLPKFMKTLAKYGGGATIIWATTTPRRNPQKPEDLAADNGRVLERNQIATDYMTRHRIIIDDLYGLVASHPEYYNLPRDFTHFNPQGRATEGTQVSVAILKALQDNKN
jgi:hypothetical protein